MPERITAPRMSRAMNASHQSSARMRRGRVLFLNEMVGRFYSDVKTASGGETIQASPINLLHTAITTIVPNLVFNNPKLKIRTDILEYREYASVLELATNKLIKKINFRMALRKAVIDSIFAAGFIKTGLATSSQVISIDGMDFNLGEPFAERVDPDDMLLDPNARDWDEQNFIGNRFTVNKVDAIDMGLDADAITRATSRFDTPGRTLEASRLSRRKKHELFERVDLAEVWVPSEQRVYTMIWQPGQTVQDFVGVRDYAGPEQGPYHMLGYTFVPDNILPVPPASIWYDLHILGNRIARKIARQAERGKRVILYDGDSVEDADAIMNAVDGETLRVNSVEGVKELNYGGSTEDSYTYMEWIKRQFSEQAGSLDQLAGTRAEAPTLGQSEILQANASVRLSDLQNQVHDFVASVSNDLMFFLHTDPLIELPLVRREKGIEEQVLYTPEMRRGEFLDYAVETEAFSMVRQDPSVRIRRMMEFFSAVIPSLVQAAQLLGPAFRLNEALESAASEMGLEDADAWVDVQLFKDMFMTQFLAQLDQGKAGQFTGQAGSSGITLGPGAATGGRPGQPVPTQQGPTGGTSLAAETNSERQLSSGETQAARGPFQ